MLLVIDAGNSNVTLGLYRGADLIAEWRLLTDPSRTFENYGNDILELFSGADLNVKDVRGISIASVVPSLSDTLRRISELHFQLKPLFIDHQTDTGLKIKYKPASSLGADRIVDAFAAVTKYGAPCIAVDFGTATTFNVVNANREYLGGAIAPGLVTSAEALFNRTAQLPRVKISKPEKAIGSSTSMSMQSGIYYGYAGLVDGLLERIIQELNDSPRVIATGGLANLVAGASRLIEQIDDTLTLEGLRLLHARSEKKNDGAAG
jgi:type III pantothenate kinase